MKWYLCATVQLVHNKWDTVQDNADLKHANKKITFIRLISGGKKKKKRWQCRHIKKWESRFPKEADIKCIVGEKKNKASEKDGETKAEIHCL